MENKIKINQINLIKLEKILFGKNLGIQRPIFVADKKRKLMDETEIVCIV